VSTITANDNWRPKPWLAALLGLFFGGAGLLYVQRPCQYLGFGDSRDNARDSRFPEIGFIPGDHIVGRVVKIVKEPNRSSRTPT
jgi:hypothetical protein